MYLWTMTCGASWLAKERATDTWPLMLDVYSFCGTEKGEDGGDKSEGEGWTSLEAV